MRLKKAKRANGRAYLSIVQNCRRPKAGKTATRALMSCGYFDELERERGDLVAHIEAHFLACCVALAALGVLQRLCPGCPSAEAILDELRRVGRSAE